MSSILCEARGRRIKDNHLIFLCVNALHLLFEPLLILKKQLALHNVVFCIGSHILDVVTGGVLVHLLASLQVALLRLCTESKTDFGRSEHTKAHSVLLASNRPHVWHFLCIQKLVARFHLRTFKHLQVIDRLL